MAINLAAYSGTLAVSTTETSLVTGATKAASGVSTLGLYELSLDLSAMVAGDQILLKVYEAILSAGTQRVIFQQQFNNIQNNPAYFTQPIILGNSWDMTLTLVSATGRSVPYAIRSVT